MELVIALTATVIAVLAYHLGLSEAIGEALARILSCPKCLTFWFTLSVLLYYGCDPIIAAGLSLVFAYLSLWIALLLMWFNNKYNEAWQRLSKKKKQ